MILFKKANDLRKWLDTQRKNGFNIGFVPTMGALHPGHISLLTRARKERSKVVASIFVNPVQFNDPADFEKYPITIEKDITALEQGGCDALFLPTVKEVYPGGLQPAPHYDLGYLETIFEGKFRPGHFQGVCRVVHRLLGIVEPDHLCLGQKDYQQCMVIRELISLTGMEKTRVLIAPTIRESDGLAMSSRNARLDAEARALAPAIYQSLEKIRKELRPGSVGPVTTQAEEELIKKGFRPDYIAVADAEDLRPITVWDGRKDIVILIAAFLGEVRLIDNLVVKENY